MIAHIFFLLTGRGSVRSPPAGGSAPDACAVSTPGFGVEPVDKWVDAGVEHWCDQEHLDDRVKLLC